MVRTLAIIFSGWGLILLAAIVSFSIGWWWPGPWLIACLAYLGLGFLLCTELIASSIVRRVWVTVSAMAPLWLSSVLLLCACFGLLPMVDAVVLAGQLFAGGLCPWVPVLSYGHWAGIPTYLWMTGMSGCLMTILLIVSVAWVVSRCGGKSLCWLSAEARRITKNRS